jgi:hypothetical protein
MGLPAARAESSHARLAISASKRLLGHLSECRAGEQVQDFGNPPAVLVAAE